MSACCAGLRAGQEGEDFVAGGEARDFVADNLGRDVSGVAYCSETALAGLYLDDTGHIVTRNPEHFLACSQRGELAVRNSCSLDTDQNIVASWLGRIFDVLGLQDTLV